VALMSGVTAYDGPMLERDRELERIRQRLRLAREGRGGALAVEGPAGIGKTMVLGAAREPDRARLRDVFRTYELRDPLRRLEEALGGAEQAAPVPSGAVQLSARVRSGSVSDIAGLAAGAAFQLFDGIQSVATGALRGAGDTRTPMLCHFTAYWIIGLPLGAWLCFRRGWGALGLWIGLSLALILIGIVLLVVWRRKVRHLMEVQPL